MAQEQIQRKNRSLRTISACNQALVRAKDEDELLDEICRTVVDIGRYRMAWVGVADPDGAKKVHPVAQAGYEDGYLDTLDITWSDTPHGRGPTGTSIRTGQAIISKNIPTDPQLAPWRAEALKRGYASSIALPLTINGRITGALNIYAAEPEAFDPEESGLLTELANDLAFGIETLRIRSERAKAVKELQASEERFHGTLENMLEGCQIIDRNWRYLYMNEAAARHGHVKREELLGRTMMEAYPGIEKTEMYSALERCMNEGVPGHMENEFSYPDF